MAENSNHKILNVVASCKLCLHTFVGRCTRDTVVPHDALQCAWCSRARLSCMQEEERFPFQVLESGGITSSMEVNSAMAARKCPGCKQGILRAKTECFLCSRVFLVYCTKECRTSHHDVECSWCLNTEIPCVKEEELPSEVEVLQILTSSTTSNANGIPICRNCKERVLGKQWECVKCHHCFHFGCETRFRGPNNKSLCRLCWNN